VSCWRRTGRACHRGRHCGRLDETKDGADEEVAPDGPGAVTVAERVVCVVLAGKALLVVEVARDEVDVAAELVDMW